MAIINHNAYLKQLESIYDQYGYSVSDTIICDFIVRKCSNAYFGTRIQNLRKILTTIHNNTPTRKPIFPPSRTVQKPVAKIVSPTSKATIETYPEYMATLEMLYLNKGEVILTDTAIQNLVSISTIDTTFGVTKTDVKKDLQTIDRKWRPPVSEPQPQLDRIYFKSKSKAKLITRKRYMSALEGAHVQNGEVLTDSQFIKLVKDNAIDNRYGVTLSEVKKDLQDMEEKLNLAKSTSIFSCVNFERELAAFMTQDGDKSFLNLYIKEFILVHGLDTKNPNLMSGIRMDLFFAQSKMSLTSSTARDFKKQVSKPVVYLPSTADSKFKSDVAMIILKHKEGFS